MGYPSGLQSGRCCRLTPYRYRRGCFGRNLTGGGILYSAVAMSSSSDDIVTFPPPISAFQFCRKQVSQWMEQRLPGSCLRLELPTSGISHIASGYSHFSRTEHPSIPPDETRENTKIVEHNKEGFSNIEYARGSAPSTIQRRTSFVKLRIVNRPMMP